MADVTTPGYQAERANLAADSRLSDGEGLQQFFETLLKMLVVVAAWLNEVRLIDNLAL